MANLMDTPKQSKGDLAHAAAKAVLSAIPVLGGPAAELFQLVIQPPLERRRAEWMAAIGEKLQELENNGVKLEQLAENEEFITAAMHASNIALRTHQQEKLDALCNAVLNVAVGQAPEDTLQHMFFRWIDSLSPLHLRMLKFFQAPTPQPGLSAGGLSSVLEHNMPELRGQRHIYDQVWKEAMAEKACHGFGSTTQVGLTQALAGMGRSSQIAILFVAALASCGLTEVMETSYPDMATAASRGGISSGWVPQWLPASAKDLREIHDIDTNESALVFNFSSSSSWRPPSQCQPVQPSVVTSSRFERSWWPASSELDSSYKFYSCPADVPPTSVFVGVHKTEQRGLHWRVTAR